MSASLVGSEMCIRDSLHNLIVDFVPGLGLRSPRTRIEALPSQTSSPVNKRMGRYALRRRPCSSLRLPGCPRSSCPSTTASRTSSRAWPRSSRAMEALP
eukprot:5170160-Alexandrium_andersonii.AAC.1